MPTYDGIGSSITHNVEVDGNLFLQDIEGGPDSTRVPLEIFSNFVSSSVESANSRMLRLRVQNYGETNPDNSYVTDMGIRGEANKDYFFITAPQNTSNVGDQNTFVISTTSNVGIGTTNPTSTLHVVGDELVTGTLSASANIVAGGNVVATNFFYGDGGLLSNVSGGGSTPTLQEVTTQGSTTSDLVTVGGLSSTAAVNVTGTISATGDITAFSDKRFKFDLDMIESALDKVKRLTGYTYTLHGNRSAGLLAQDVLEVLPEVVKGSEETNYSLAYGNLMGLVVEAIKELDKKVDRILEKHGST